MPQMLWTLEKADRLRSDARLDMIAGVKYERSSDEMIRTVRKVEGYDRVNDGLYRSGGNPGMSRNPREYR